MSLPLRPLMSALAVPLLLVVMLLEAPAIADLATHSPVLLTSVGLLVTVTCIMSTGIFLADRAHT